MSSSTEKKSEEEIKDYLLKYFKHSKFKSELQKKAVEAVVNGNFYYFD